MVGIRSKAESTSRIADSFASLPTRLPSLTSTRSRRGEISVGWHQRDAELRSPNARDCGAPRPRRPAHRDCYPTCRLPGQGKPCSPHAPSAVFRLLGKLATRHPKAGGEGGIRTPGTLASTPDFESGPFNRTPAPLSAEDREASRSRADRPRQARGRPGSAHAGRLRPRAPRLPARRASGYRPVGHVPGLRSPSHRARTREPGTTLAPPRCGVEWNVARPLTESGPSFGEAAYLCRPGSTSAGREWGRGSKSSR